MSTAKRLVLIFALTAMFTLLAASVALAAGTVIPHGGYDTLTDACLQCHDIHEAGSDYVLLRWPTVLDTCGSCHYLYSGQYPNSSGGSFGQGWYEASPVPGEVPAYNPGYNTSPTADGPFNLGPQDETRTVLPTANNLGSRTSAYEVAWGDRTSHSGHRLQQNATNMQNGSSYLFADGVTAQADYIPGGTSRLTAIEQAAYPNTVNALSYTGTNGLYCASCHTPHGNYGQELYLTGTSTTAKGKILSGKPNHTSPRLEIASWATEGSLWCQRCHDKRSSDPLSTYHNHPDTYCLVCHANPAGAGGSTDFPHTSDNSNLLSKEPDALCIDCHKAGLLP